MKCKRGCCWTPHQLCARKYQCACHNAVVAPRSDLGRAQAVAAMKGTRR